MTKNLPKKVQLKIARLERENEELRAKIANHMRVYGETLGELVTYKVRLENALDVLKGVEE